MMMTRQETVALFEGRQALWDRRDVGGLAALHAPDSTVISPIFGTIHGQAAIEASYRELFRVFADWTFKSDDLIVDGAKAAQVFTVQATHNHDLFGVPGTGRRFEIHGVLFFEMDGPLIRQERRLYDFTAMLIQLGVLKAKPGKD
jgi:steroid delta-isomerase-like uncharacterized protein